VCAVQRRRFQWVQVPPGNAPAGSNRSVMEVTKWLKPSIILRQQSDGYPSACVESEGAEAA